jgi:hypothetical protein
VPPARVRPSSSPLRTVSAIRARAELLAAQSAETAAPPPARPTWPVGWVVCGCGCVVHPHWLEEHVRTAKSHRPAVAA